jgi:molecular chaperone HscB
MLSKNHFELFGLAPAFDIDTAQLDRMYLRLQVQLHPDRHAVATDQERMQALQWATRVNEAYQTLKEPLSRARYLLQLKGIETDEESNTAMPAEFLMRQMEWREAIEEARNASDIGALEALGRELRQEADALERTLAEALDRHGDHAEASAAVRKLRFLDRVRSEIESAIEFLEEQH